MTFKDLMKRKHITQEELAAKLGTSQSAVSLWCTGKSYPHITMIFKIAAVLNVSPERLVKCFERAEQ